MWITYSDSEVANFHPVCETALNRALVLLGKNAQYRVLHHQYTGTLEMDFVIQNIVTGKYFCVIEVKRTPADIHSARYQYQALSYVQMNANTNEEPFYILTNLEYAFSFRYDSTRPRVFQQMLKPGLFHIDDFSASTEESFTNNLSEFFSDLLADFFNNKFEYSVTLEEFATHMEQIKSNSKQWKSHLAVLLYEYIRGAFTFLHRNVLHDIRIFGNDVPKICEEAAAVNFKDIFNYSESEFEPQHNITNSMLSNLYDLGNQNVSGDSLSAILHQIVSFGHEHDGEVPTDLELGRLVAVLAKHSCGELSETDLVCDPAAGSGNLISSAIEILHLTPKQIIANDYNSKLLELLSLRLGLNFAITVNKQNSPAIYNYNVVDLTRDFFCDVKILIMNPPFVAGINCVTRKEEFYRAIKSLAHGDIKTNVGQMPLEAVFLELITLLVNPGTTIACVFPKTHLLARGTEARIIRKLIIENLGLNTIFTYPGTEIFDDVTKDTCVLVGKALQPSETIKILSSYENIPNLDSHRFEQMLNDEYSSVFASQMPGVVGRIISKSEFIDSINDGWRALNSEMVEAVTFVKEQFENSKVFERLDKFSFEIKRGGAGNSGGSDLMFISSSCELLERYATQLSNLKVGMRNAKLGTFCVGNGDSQFLDSSHIDADLLESIVVTYLNLPGRESKQQRKDKTAEQLKQLLNRESRNVFKKNSVLIPRAIRKEGKIYLSESAVFVSTNFVVCTTPSEDTALLLSTWMSTIFYQLICEVSSKDQEGMRKMEVTDIGATWIPNLSNISTHTVEMLKVKKSSIKFLNLKSPEIREVDKIWADELFGDNAELLLAQAKRLLAFLACSRNR